MREFFCNALFLDCQKVLLGKICSQTDSLVENPRISYSKKANPYQLLFPS